MNIDFGMVKIHVNESGTSVTYNVTQPMVDAALSEAKKIGLVVSENQIKQILQSVIVAA